MKKIILLLILATAFTFSPAQKANVKKAMDKALNEDKPDFAAAREAIQLALKDSTTKNNAETWYVAGLIGNKESEIQFKKAILNLPYDTLKKGKSMMESYDYLIQAIKYDNLPDAKGKVKPKFANKIKPILKDYYSTRENLIGYGAFAYGKENYDEAYRVFKAYLEIPKLPIMNNEIKMDSVYNMISFYTALSASAVKKHKEAIQILTEMKDKNYQLSAVYQNLAVEYLSLKDSATYLKTLKEGIDKFPKQSWFLQNLINFYIHSNKIPDAIAYLNTAIQMEPKNGQYYFVKGQLELTTENFDEANLAFSKAIELDPNNADYYAEAGRSYYNKAIKLSLELNKIKDINQFKLENAKVEEVFKQAIPFYKKAIELKPKEVDYMTPLKQLYYRLQMDADYEAINKQIKALQ